MKAPVGCASNMGEERQDGGEIVRPEEQLIRGHMEARCGKIKVGVEVENAATVKHCAHVHEQEEHEHHARSRLQPGDDAAPAFPAARDEPCTADYLERDTRQKKGFDDGLTVDPARDLHEGDMRGDPCQRHQVIDDMDKGKRGDEDDRSPMKRAEIHG